MKMTQSVPLPVFAQSNPEPPEHFNNIIIIVLLQMFT
jgi:hypothetical protein